MNHPDYTYLRTVAVLFASADSIYKSLRGCDVWDAKRDARKFSGGAPVVAHPPCGHYGRLRKLCTKPVEEKSLGPLAVEFVRRCGGVLEHPAGSKLWDAMSLPKPTLGPPDSHGGWTMAIPQWWWGHKANKATWLYIIGVKPSDVPQVPLRIGSPLYTVSTRKESRPTMRLRGLIGEMPKSERAETPSGFALWLVELARRCFRP